MVPTKRIVDARGGFGMGDILMLTPALAAQRRLYPDVRIEYFGTSSASDILAHSGLVDRIVELGAEDEIPGANDPGVRVFNMRGCVAKEGTVRLAFHALELPGMADDRRLRYTVLPAERDAAVAHLSPIIDSLFNRNRLDPAPYVVAIQTRGGWASKRWKSWNMLACRLVMQKAIVLIVGNHDGREATKHHNIVDLRGKTHIRLALALISLCDAYVGLDSGLTLGAMAAGCPTVAITGTHDSRFLLGDVQANNLAIIRKRTPEECFQNHGLSCRSGKCFGEYCPLRLPPGRQQSAQLIPLAKEDMPMGAACLDEIRSDDVLKELAAFPRWNREMYARYPHVCV